MCDRHTQPFATRPLLLASAHSLSHPPTPLPHPIRLSSSRSTPQRRPSRCHLPVSPSLSFYLRSWTHASPMLAISRTSSLLLGTSLSPCVRRVALSQVDDLVRSAQHTLTAPEHTAKSQGKHDFALSPPFYIFWCFGLIVLD